MNQATPFVISQFTNPSGEIVFRVSGWLDGKRVRKNIATRPEAEAERQVLEVQRLQGETGIRTAVTRLVDDQLHEAESVFRRLDGRRHSLSFYVEFALANYREPLTQKLLTEAVAEFLVIKDHEREQDLLSEPYLTRVKRDLKRLQKHFPAATVADLTGTRLLGYFEARRLETNFRGTARTAQRYMRLAECIADIAFLQGMSLRQAYARLGIATEPKTQSKRALTHKLPAHLVHANRLVRALKRRAGQTGEEQGEAYRCDLRALYEKLRPWFEPSPGMRLNFRAPRGSHKP